MKAIDTCEQCGEPVQFEHVTRVQTIKQTAFAIYKHSCGWVNQTRFDSLEAYEAAKETAERQSSKSYDTEAVGVQVAGFRIDLDAVETVEDLEVYWFDDRRYRIG